MPNKIARCLRSAVIRNCGHLRDDFSFSFFLLLERQFVNLPRQLVGVGVVLTVGSSFLLCEVRFVVDFFERELVDLRDVVVFFFCVDEERVFV